MKISVIGLGYLGAVHAAAMADFGHEVVGIDIDPNKVAALAAGIPPFFEPGLPEILQAGLRSGRLSFSTDICSARGAAVHFLAVGTPQKPGEAAADMKYVDAAIESLIPHLSEGDLIVGKSTVPVGTAGRLASTVAARKPGAILAWNPEFLREGFAVEDTMSPDRLVYGVPDGPSGIVARELLNKVYEVALSRATPLVVTDYATAELVKVSANAFLATKLSFINAMAEIAEVVGADVISLADALGYDERIGRRFLNAGIGFGGGCLPKDIRAFAARAEELGRGKSVQFLKEVDLINLRRRQRVVDLVLECVDGELEGKKVAVLGLAFKPNSDDIRDSPALDVAARLEKLGAQVVATDPKAIANARRSHPQIDYTTNVTDTLADADVVVVVTEWQEFRQIDPISALAVVRGAFVVDGRNCLDAEKWRSAGWTYRGLGRP
jgi:UDPglucose 6-dehydrogenase